ncbi:uncharacterized protein LACBIDRAFT_326077 [Laccaria bicolor S238N-H82]|uniref:Predicted protein n=1 Tax=Laccaria bicolor (strain S238N-H82 / ATCC MYA-4686) TaxID=486041 RepID=B0D781_LACBS|nr:uncharacterized protein LACBIDRAFT_326077 [Laccaria bicolor S238N-H82]EDR09604.1 predicted protein [Laccaria bicolor S238N-H82]|eukprot:XP_001879953.1 predicted protein [Laccaria bicolor S238N-H82]
MICDDADRTVALTTTGRGNPFDIEEVRNIDEDANHDISNVFYAAQPPSALAVNTKAQKPNTAAVGACLAVDTIFRFHTDWTIPFTPFGIALPSFGSSTYKSPEMAMQFVLHAPLLLTPFKVPREARVVEPEDWYWKSPMMETSGGCWEARLGGA